MFLTAVAAMTILYQDSFDSLKNWQPTDPSAWVAENGRARLIKDSVYSPPHRSPFNILLFKERQFGSFDLTIHAKSTIPDYGHRDLCVIFGYQGPDRFYYAHLGKVTDDHANQIFIVNQADRVKISTKTTPGTPWDDWWHTIRIVRDAESGLIRVYFDDMATPVMEATDRRFESGQIGIGAFDDTGDFDDLIIKSLS